MVSQLLAIIGGGSLSAAFALLIMELRTTRAENRTLRQELRRRDVAERAARSLERMTPTAAQTEIRRIA